MEKTIQLLLAVTALAILAEVTYLVVKLPRQNISKRAGRPILVDTSVLIDGRIISVAKSGFIGDTLVIPRSVIGELQFLADNADHDKRTRARYGLDVVKELQNMPHMVVEILQDGSKAEEGVDERLLTLAKKYSAAVCTIDYNLNKVAVVEGITVLNVNELAQSLRMAYLPGEKMLLELVQKGQDSHQGVGYLTDGTMVVVENASKQVGQTVEIEFIRSLQTAAGKMMFAKPTERSTPPKPQPLHKPAGKKPVREAQQPVHEPKPAPTVYHSDSDKNARQRPEKKQHVEQRPPRPQPQRQYTKKPRTSADREASLIDLVDKQ
ncbi:MAG: putative PilT domain containing protein [Candidatus Saccharibacteria bacterium]|nr:putative PilT domain containing protein [Candidatus Saccharibacteria bacterium]